MNGQARVALERPKGGRVLIRGRVATTEAVHEAESFSTGLHGVCMRAPTTTSRDVDAIDGHPRSGSSAAIKRGHSCYSHEEADTVDH